MEISAEKTKLWQIQREIKVKEQKLGTVTSFKYLGAVISDHGSKSEILSKIAQATAALTKLKLIWRDNNISIGSKVKLMHFLLSWHSHISVCLWIVDLHNWIREKNIGLWDEMLSNAFEYFLQGPCYQWWLRFTWSSKQRLENMMNSWPWSRNRWMMDDLWFYVLFNSVSVISGRWPDDNERLCAMEPHLRLRRFRLERGSNSGPLDQQASA